MNARRAPCTIFQPASTSARSSSVMSAASWYRSSVRRSDPGFGSDTNSGSRTAARRALASARSTPRSVKSLGSLPNPTRSSLNTAWIPRPRAVVDLGSSTPLHGMWEV